MNPLSASNREPASHLLSSELFKQFLDERRYLKNVTADTIEWYETAFKAVRRALNDDAPAITKASLQSFVVRMRQRNVKQQRASTREPRAGHSRRHRWRASIEGAPDF